MRFAYADPPYLDQGKKLYQRPEWDNLEMHAVFIRELHERYPFDDIFPGTGIFTRTWQDFSK